MSNLMCYIAVMLHNIYKRHIEHYFGYATIAADFNRFSMTGLQKQNIQFLGPITFLRALSISAVISVYLHYS